MNRIDAILYTDNQDSIPEELKQGQPQAVKGNKRLHYVRIKPDQIDALKEHYNVIAETPYKGIGTADYLYEYIQQRGELSALYHEVCPLRQLYWTDPETGEVDYDAAMGTEFVRFGMLAESPLPVPKSVSQRQLRLVLAEQGFLSDVERAIGNIPDEKQRQMAGIEWQFASEIERDNAWINAMYDQLGISQEDVDGIFIQASQI